MIFVLHLFFQAIYKGLDIPEASLKASLACRQVFKESDLDGDGRLSEYEFIQHMLTKLHGMLGAPVSST